MKKPKVSIGVLSYNNAKYLKTTIEGILSQTYNDFEVIIVDDGSTDESLAIAQEFELKDRRVKVLTHPDQANRGISATCNLAVQKSGGEYIALLASDDVYYSNYIERAVEHLDSNPEVGFICGKVQCINEKGGYLPEIFGVDISIEKDPIKELISLNKINAPTVMVRRECYNTLGLYDEELIYSDWDMWIRLLTVYKIGFIPEKLTKYRIHTNNISVGIEPDLRIDRVNHFYQKLKQKIYFGDLTFGESKYGKVIEKKIKSLPKKKAKMHIDNYYEMLRQESISSALQHLKKAFSVSPLTVLNPRTIVAIIRQALLNKFSGKR